MAGIARAKVAGLPYRLAQSGNHHRQTFLTNDDCQTHINRMPHQHLSDIHNRLDGLKSWLALANQEMPHEFTKARNPARSQSCHSGAFAVTSV